MELNKVIKYLDKKFNPNLASNWDNSGFQIFNKKIINLDKNINKVLVCLDVTSDVVDYAVDNNSELIISRHPLVFDSLDEEKKVKKDLFDKLTKNDIYVFSIHTTYDRSSNQNLLELINKELPINKSKRFGDDIDGFEIDLKDEIKPEEFIFKINKVFPTGICQLNSGFNFDRNIKKFFIVTGSGADVLIESRLQHQVFVTGEAKWNQMIDANTLDDSVILKGHYMEEYFVDDVAEKIANSFKELEVEKYNIGNQIKDYK